MSKFVWLIPIPPMHICRHIFRAIKPCKPTPCQGPKQGPLCNPSGKVGNSACCLFRVGKGDSIDQEVWRYGEILSPQPGQKQFIVQIFRTSFFLSADGHSRIKINPGQRPGWVHSIFYFIFPTGGAAAWFGCPALMSGPLCPLVRYNELQVHGIQEDYAVRGNC